MKKLCYIFLLTFLFQGQIAHSQNETKRYFAVGIFTSGHSQMITYAFITMIGNNMVGAEIVRPERFMYTALGYWPDPKYNPNRINLFEKFNVDSCFLIKNGNKVVGYYAKPFEELWKIRFYEHPYNFDTPGWSQGQYTPSVYQNEFLRKEYGLNNILTEYIYGDSLFKLLRNVQSQAWIMNYKTAARDTTSRQ